MRIAGSGHGNRATQVAQTIARLIRDCVVSFSQFEARRVATGLSHEARNNAVKNNAVIIKADVPLSEMFGYVTQLRTITSGRASSSMEFSHYAPTPMGLAKEVIERARGEVSV